MVKRCFDVIFGLLLCVYCSSLAASAQAGAVQYGKQVVLGVPVDVVRVDLNSRHILVTPERPLSFPHFSSRGARGGHRAE
ncbi:MAG: hypothetical protein HYU64_09675 [Armatimonadetes bacterium]|nr:hypothetical protein [Armatimonadota bacterium]